MKLILVVVAAVSFALCALFRGYAAVFVLSLSGAFLLYGIAQSAGRRLDSFNDVPNALRFFMASAAGGLFAFRSGFIDISTTCFLFVGSLLLNDEYQRRTFDSLRKRRRGGAVALLGIDGSGKSTHSGELEGWFRSRGYYCTNLPFHRYLFVEILASARRGDGAAPGGRRGGNPLRPLLSAADNLILWVATSLGRGVEGRVVLYDRFIWSTYVKYAALGYPVAPVRWLYLLPRPKFAIVLDVPVEKSMGVIGSRPDHIRYTAKVLAQERAEYLSIAKRSGFPVVDATREYSSVQSEIEGLLAQAFPVRPGVTG